MQFGYMYKINETGNAVFNISGPVKFACFCYPKTPAI